jgi:predicted metalloendopeptidase
MVSEQLAQLKAEQARALLDAQEAAQQRVAVQAQRDAVARTLAGQREELLRLKKQQSTVLQAVEDAVTVVAMTSRS